MGREQRNVNDQAALDRDLAYLAFYFNPIGDDPGQQDNAHIDILISVRIVFQNPQQWRAYSNQLFEQVSDKPKKAKELESESLSRLVAPLKAVNLAQSLLLTLLLSLLGLVAMKCNNTVSDAMTVIRTCGATVCLSDRSRLSRVRRRK